MEEAFTTVLEMSAIHNASKTKLVVILGFIDQPTTIVKPLKNTYKEKLPNTATQGFGITSCMNN